MKPLLRRLLWLSLGAIPGAITGLLIPERLLWPAFNMLGICLAGFLGLWLLARRVSRSR